MFYFVLETKVVVLVSGLCAQHVLLNKTVVMCRSFKNTHVFMLEIINKASYYASESTYFVNFQLNFDSNVLNLL